MINVSVIIPVYKISSNYLRACLDTLAAQTMQACEFIVVSDGAPEAVCSICEEYAQKDTRFIFFKRKHAGVSATRNFAIEQAQGEFITFVDSDDWIEKTTCQIAYDYAKKNSSEMLFWDCRIVEENGVATKTFFSESKISLLNEKDIRRFKEKVIYAAHATEILPELSVCKLFRKDIINKFKIRFNNKLTYGEDRVFVFAYASNCKKISYLNETFYNYRMHSQSTTHQMNRSYLEDSLKYITKLDSLANGDYKDCLGNELWKAYCVSWNRCYMHPHNDIPLQMQIVELKKIIISEQFHNILLNAAHRNQNLFRKIELFFLKHKIVNFVWAHVVIKHILDKTHFH